MAQLKKILLVVGDEDLRKALTEQLMLSEDFKVSEGPDGAQAIEKHSDNKIICVAMSFTKGDNMFALLPHEQKLAQ